MAKHEPALEQIRAALKTLGWTEKHGCDNEAGIEMAIYTNKNGDNFLLSAEDDTRTYNHTPTSLSDLLGQIGRLGRF
jgi:hypothetical protein